MLPPPLQFVATASVSNFLLCIAIVVDQQLPRRFEDKISPSTNYGPVNLGDSDDDEEDEFDLEIEKQRRRANAAVLALETAAKEADEDALAGTRKGSDCKRPCENVKKKLTKVHRERCVPSPAGPPPAGASRKGRRGQGVPPPRWAQKLTELPSYRLKLLRTQNVNLACNNIICSASKSNPPVVLVDYLNGSSCASVEGRSKA